MTVYLITRRAYPQVFRERDPFFYQQPCWSRQKEVSHATTQ